MHARVGAAWSGRGIRGWSFQGHQKSFHVTQWSDFPGYCHDDVNNLIFALRRFWRRNGDQLRQKRCFHEDNDLTVSTWNKKVSQTIGRAFIGNPLSDPFTVPVGYILVLNQRLLAEHRSNCLKKKYATMVSPSANYQDSSVLQIEIAQHIRWKDTRQLAALYIDWFNFIQRPKRRLVIFLYNIS